ncbi:MAG: rod shape-determining protein MreD [Clostridia bacterium]|nr:rod shape-determining protein MreD [Clostridia bacterium]
MKTTDSTKKTRVFFSIVFLLVFFVNASIIAYIGAGSEGGNAVVPDLLLALAAVCGIICPDVKGVSVIALVFGVISDVFITPPAHLSPFLFFIAAYFAKKTVNIFTRTNALTAALASVPFFLIRAFVGSIYVMSEYKESALSEVLKKTILPEFALNVLSVVVMYLIVNFLYKKFKRRFYLM